MPRRPLLILLLAVAALVPAVASAHRAPAGPERSWLGADGVLDSGLEAHEQEAATARALHRGKGGHLRPTRKGVEVVGRGRVRDAAEGRVGDVAARGRYAYLAGYREPRCGRGGVYVMDIANPARPRQVAFLRARPGSYAGEGMQVIPLRTRAFRGDVLVQNNEICRPNPRAVGGITLIDVRNPRRPRKLVDGAGDRSNADGTVAPIAHQVHSAFMWQQGGRAFVVTVDDEEAADVDILEITDPRRPRLISETDLNALGVEQPRVNGEQSFLHDMTVKPIRGVQTMLASYWDGGYAQLDVNDPARPRLISHTDFAVPDPQRAGRGQRDLTPEGNAHQAEFDHRNRFFLATDEDFEPTRITSRVTSGPERGRQFEVVQGGAAGALGTNAEKEEGDRDDGSQIDSNTSVTGPSVLVGLGCEPAAIPPSRTTGASVAIVERGVCEFSAKARNVASAGYRGAIVFNRTGLDGGCDSPPGGVFEGSVPILFVTRSEGFRLLGAFDPDEYRCADEEGEDPEEDTPAPAVGTAGVSVDVRSTFDGWGYVHLYERASAREVDTYAIPEAQSKRYAEGFGDLSVHEVATDPSTNLAYLSYYAGGFRVVRFDRRGIREVGRYVGRGGNNFWGVEVHRHPNGRKYVLASDRDYGLYVFRVRGL
jgi:hypothetical protein